jgi:hypothetical protein
MRGSREEVLAGEKRRLRSCYKSIVRDRISTRRGAVVFETVPAERTGDAHIASFELGRQVDFLLLGWLFLDATIRFTSPLLAPRVPLNRNELAQFVGDASAQLAVEKGRKVPGQRRQLRQQQRQRLLRRIAAPPPVSLVGRCHAAIARLIRWLRRRSASILSCAAEGGSTNDTTTRSSVNLYVAKASSTGRNRSGGAGQRMILPSRSPSWVIVVFVRSCLARLATSEMGWVPAARPSEIYTSSTRNGDDDAAAPFSESASANPSLTAISKLRRFVLPDRDWQMSLQLPASSANWGRMDKVDSGTFRRSMSAISCAFSGQTEVRMNWSFASRVPVVGADEKKSFRCGGWK